MFQKYIIESAYLDKEKENFEEFKMVFTRNQNQKEKYKKLKEKEEELDNLEKELEIKIFNNKFQGKNNLFLQIFIFGFFLGLIFNYFLKLKN